jgi:threonine 3-dehydrogenase
MADTRATPVTQAAPADNPPPGAAGAASASADTAAATRAPEFFVRDVTAAGRAPVSLELVPDIMRALVKEAPGQGARIREVPVPRPGPGEVLIRVEAAGVGGTDVRIGRWDEWARENGRLPLILGREAAGRVVRLGESITRLRIGQLVAVESHLVDWTCYPCRTGREYVCRNLRIVGVHTPGVFAEYAVLPEENAWPSDGLAPEIAALQEPMGSAVFATFFEELAGESVAVLGCGPVGLMAVAVAKRGGARRVFATDVVPDRLALAERMGADVCTDAADDVVARLKAETGGDGVDVVLEMSGTERALHQGLAAVTNGGRVSLAATHANPVTIDVSSELISRGVRVHGVTGRRLFETWYHTRAFLEEGLDPTPIITHRLPLSRHAEAFELVESRRCGKVLLLPQEE